MYLAVCNSKKFCIFWWKKYELEIDSLMFGSLDIDKNAMLQMFVCCDDGIVSTAEKIEITKYLYAINESL